MELEKASPSEGFTGNAFQTEQVAGGVSSHNEMGGDEDDDTMEMVNLESFLTQDGLYNSLMAYLLHNIVVCT